MRLLIDAQLPRRLAHQLREHGHDAVHTLDLPDQNRTPDESLLQEAAREERVMITKDADFVNSFLLRRRPAKLLLVSTGNVSNRELMALFAANWPRIEAAFTSADYLELSRSSLIVHV